MSPTDDQPRVRTSSWALRVFGPVVVILALLLGANRLGSAIGRWYDPTTMTPVFAELSDPAFAPSTAKLPVLRELWSVPRSTDRLPTRLAVVGRWLVIAGTGRVTRIDLRDGETAIVADAVRNRATGSVWDVTSLMAGGPRSAWISDASKGLLTLLDLERTDANPRRVIAFEANVMGAGLFGDTIVGNPLSSTDLLRLYTLPAGVTLAADAPCCRDGGVERATRLRAIEGVPYEGLVWQLGVILNESIMAPHPARDRLVLAFKFSSRLHVYAATGRLERAIAGLRDVRLDFKVRRKPGNPSTFVRIPETRPSYVAVTADDTFIYGLFSGRSIGEYGGDHMHGDELHVFRWSGEVVGRWTLGKAIAQVAVEPGTGRLFGLTMSPRPAVIELDAHALRPGPDAARTTAP
jgi:hypothetical protein